MPGRGAPDLVTASGVCWLTPRSCSRASCMSEAAALCSVRMSLWFSSDDSNSIFSDAQKRCTSFSWCCTPRSSVSAADARSAARSILAAASALVHFSCSAATALVSDS